MSAFIVSQGTMDRVVAAILSRGEYGENLTSFAGILPHQPDAGTQIGRKLYAMNVKAVVARYGSRIDSVERATGRDYVFKGRAGMKMGASELAACLKAMSCLSYQCSEGNVPSSKLYKELDKAAGTLAMAAVSMSPAYNAAAWD